MRKNIFVNKSIWLVFLFLSVIFACSFSSASDFIIHLDNTGKALFFGSADTNISLPDGVYYDNGKIRGETYDLTSKEGKIWTFSFNKSDSEIQVYLPNNFRIIQTNGEVSVSGRNFIIYSSENIIVSYTIEESNGSNFGIYIIAAIILIVLIGLYFSYKKGYFQIKKKNDKFYTRRPDKLKIIEKVLNEKERIIIDYLKKNNKVKSNYLRKMCNLPKSSFFRHLQELEKKKIIVRYGDGRNKFVKLLR